LSGPIPTEFGQLDTLRNANFAFNRLTGAIPWQLGNLTSLEYLGLQANQFTGAIPSELGNLTLIEPGRLYLRWNALYNSDPALVAFLNEKAYFGAGWADLQTVAPLDLTADESTSTTVTLSWDPIAYTDHGGGYEALYATSAGGSYTVFSPPTDDKTVSSMVVTGLSPDTIYFFVVRTFTDPHSNQNTVISENSEEVSFATIP